MTPLRRRGFSLIELMVVIAVIAILAAILLPVFATVKRRAQLTACSANLRQIGQAFTQYLSDHKRGPNWSGVVGGPWNISADWKASGAVNYRQALGTVLGSLRRNYASDDAAIFFCPGDVYYGEPGSTLAWGTAAAVDGGEPGYTAIANWFRRSGEMYTTLAGGGNFRRIGNAQAFIARPLDAATANGSELCLLADNGLFTATDGVAKWPHDRAGNVLTVDGAVKNLPRGAFLSQFAPIQPTGPYAAYALNPLP